MVIVTQSDLDAVEPLLKEMDPRWWEKNDTHQLLARAFALGRESIVNPKDDGA